MRWFITRCVAACGFVVLGTVDFVLDVFDDGMNLAVEFLFPEDKQND